MNRKGAFNMTIYGYTRISTPKQSIERQIRNIKAEYPTAVILQEEYSGTKITRPKFDKLLCSVKSGDVIVFDSVSRMSRCAADGFSVYQMLYNNGVELVFLKEPQINTLTYKKAIANSLQLTGTSIDFILDGINKYLLELAKEQIKLAFEQAEKEVEDLHQRTKEGIITARLNGKQIGNKAGTRLTTQKSISAKKIISLHLVDFGGTLNNAECQQLAGISRNSFYKYKQELILENMVMK